MAKRIVFFLLLFLLVMALAPVADAAPGDPAVGAQPMDPAGVQRLEQATAGEARVSISAATGAASFVSLPAASSAELHPLAGDSASVEAKAMAFFSEYGSIFGITDPYTELRLEEKIVDAFDMTHLVYHQSYQGVPVFAADLRVHFDVQERLTAVNGVFIPDLNLDTRPTISTAEAETVAVQAAAKTKKTAATDLTAAPAVLYVFRPGLVQDIPGPNILVYEVVVSGPNVREFIYVDAHTATVVEQFTGIHDDLSREVSEETLANVVWTEGNPDPIPSGWSGGSSQQVTDWQNEIDGAKEIYNTIGSLTNGSWLSYDSVDAHMRTVNNDPSISCPNANWNGTTTNYCSNVTGDDTVAHEWGHAYTEYTHGLIYAWQPGALNESYSDIWGEIVDLINGRGKDTPGGPRSADGSECSFYAWPKGSDSSYRWLSGEDDPAFVVPIRDMWRPECLGDPGKVTASDYHCTEDDGGGVHTNSGVPNHGFALIVDGGTYNGQTTTGLGLTKAAHIYWRAQSVYQTSTTKFVDHADAIEQACLDLTGVALNDITVAGPPWPGVGSETITSGDCDQVAAVMLAVEMRTDPSQCNFQSLLDPNTPNRCEAGAGPVNFYREDFESGSSDWETGSRDTASSFTPRAWEVVSSLPSGRSGSAVFGIDPDIGNCASQDESGVIFIDSPIITVPGDASTVLGAFQHYVATEVSYDGGNIKVSVNGGAFQLLNSANFSFNPYNGSLDNSSDNTDPLKGQKAFHGTNGGEVFGTWGESQLNLNSLLNPGDTVQFRYEMGTDGCSGIDGWYVDELELFQCQTCTTPATPVSEIATVSADVKLSWNHDSANGSYKIYASANPYFQPGDAGVTENTLWSPFAALVEWLDAGAAADTSQPTFYLVRGINPCGEATTNSDETGAFNFSLTPGDS